MFNLPIENNSQQSEAQSIQRWRTGTRLVIASAFLAPLVLLAYHSLGSYRRSPEYVPYVPPISVYEGELKSVEFYAEKLTDDSFYWMETPEIYYGGFREQMNGASRALAFIGDPAVPALLQAAEDPKLDDYQQSCVLTALCAIGLPAADATYANPITVNRDASLLREWWEANRKSTKADRSENRKSRGLPPVE